MMLVIRTQYMENYAWREDGTIGTGAEAYWKCKGGSEYKVTGVPLNIDFAEVVAMADVERNDDYVREYVIDWSVEADDYMSEFERSQQEYEGRIAYPEPTVEYSVLQNRYTDPAAYAEAAADADAVAYAG